MLKKIILSVIFGIWLVNIGFLFFATSYVEILRHLIIAIIITAEFIFGGKNGNS